MSRDALGMPGLMGHAPDAPGLMGHTPDTPGLAGPAPGTPRLIALLRLASPMLPIGGYSYSQGLETAIDRGWVHDEPSAAAWIAGVLGHTVARFELPLSMRVCAAVQAGDMSEARRLCTWYLASRETPELRAESLQMGWSLLQVLRGLPAAEDAIVQAGLAGNPDDEPAHESVGDAVDPLAGGPPRAPALPVHRCLPMAWALAARLLDLPPREAGTAWAWAWLENQVMAAIKAVPLGQQAGQRLLGRLGAPLARAIDEAAALDEQDWSSFAPGFAMAGCWHEQQYSRLFRS